eukprot:jgi/Galph1/71/GphlegSOOS_G4769.1
MSFIQSFLPDDSPSVVQLEACGISHEAQEAVFVDSMISRNTLTLDSVSLKIFEREFLLIIGENGSGKSTLLTILAGLEVPQIGWLKWYGKKIDSKQLVSKIGIVFQFPQKLFVGDSVLEELTLGLKHVLPQDVEEVMTMCGLTGISLTCNPTVLSGGQKKKLAIASQLLRKPLILFLDEPLSGVDSESRKQLISLFDSLRYSLSIVIVSHEPAELLSKADRVLQLSNSRLHKVPNSVIRKALAVRREREQISETT